jgi:hypothetical protein
MAEFNFVSYKNHEPLTDEWKHALSVALEALWDAWNIFSTDSEFSVMVQEKYDIRHSVLYALNIYHSNSGTEKLALAHIMDTDWLKVQDIVEAELAEMFSLPQPLQEEGSQSVEGLKWECGCAASGKKSVRIDGVGFRAKFIESLQPTQPLTDEQREEVKKFLKAETD